MNQNCYNCNPFLKWAGACGYTNEYYNMNLSLAVLVEIFFIFISAAIYPFIVYLGIQAFFQRNNRALYIFMNLIIICIFTECTKDILKSPRPQGSCKTNFGNPSNHAAMAYGLATWFYLEKEILSDKCQAIHSQYNQILIYLVNINAVFTPYARYFLNYHTITQIICGIFSGIVISSLIFFALMIYDYINENKTKVLKDYWNNIYHVSIQDVKNKSD